MIARRHHLSWVEVRTAVLESCVLGIACLLAYWLVSQVLARFHSVSRPDDLLGGLWAVIATVFVCRSSYQQSIGAAVSRVAATAVSFGLCLVYLVFLPFHLWALAVLIGASALAVMLLGRPGDASRPPSPRQSSWEWQPSAPTKPGNSPFSGSPTPSWALPSGSPPPRSACG